MHDIYFMGTETLPSTCYVLSDESSIPFYSTSHGYKYRSYNLFHIIFPSGIKIGQTSEVNNNGIKI